MEIEFNLNECFKDHWDLMSWKLPRSLLLSLRKADRANFVKEAIPAIHAFMGYRRQKIRILPNG